MHYRGSKWPAILACVFFATALLAACSKGDSSSSNAAPRLQQVHAGLGDLSSYRCALKISGSGGPLADLQSLFSAPAAGGTPAVSTTASAAADIGFEASVNYVKPDKSQMTIKVGSETFTQTTIGRQQWSSLGGLTVGPNTVAAQSASDLSLCNAFWDEGFADAAASFQCGGASARTEKVNGRDTLKCTIASTDFDQIKAALGGVLNNADAGIRDLSRFTMDIWVTDGSGKVPGGLPVRFQADMAGKDTTNRDFAMKINMDLTDMNSSSVSVKAPK